MKANALKLSLLIPVRNEGVNLKIMLNVLEATVEIPHEILIVYDAEDDNSIPIVKGLQKNYPNLRLIHNKRGRGVANAIISGVGESSGKYILILAADDMGPVMSIEQMVSLMDAGYDFVSATRYAKGGRVFGGRLMSRFFSRTTNFLFYWLAGSKVTDSTIGIKMFRKSMLSKISIKSKPVGWVITFEMSMKAQLAGLKMGEVPIVSINRFYGGKSSFRLRSWSREYFRWFFWGFWNLCRFRMRR